MSSDNLGSQSVTFDYKNEATAKSFNTFLRTILKSGIYSGGELSKVDNTTVAIAPFSAWFNVGTDKACHVTTSNSILLSASSATPVLYMYYEWSDTENNWVDFAFRAAGSAAVTNEIVLGTINFTGINLTGTFDYTLRTNGLIDSSNNLYALNTIKFDNVSDVSLYKSATNTLRTPNNFSIGGTLAVTGNVIGNLTLTGNISAANISTDVTLSSDSNSLISTQHAVKYYVDNLNALYYVANPGVYLGYNNFSGNGGCYFTMLINGIITFWDNYGYFPSAPTVSIYPARNNGLLDIYEGAKYHSGYGTTVSGGRTYYHFLLAPGTYRSNWTTSEEVRVYVSGGFGITSVTTGNVATITGWYGVG